MVLGPRLEILSENPWSLCSRIMWFVHSKQNMLATHQKQSPVSRFPSSRMYKIGGAISGKCFRAGHSKLREHFYQAYSSLCRRATTILSSSTFFRKSCCNKTEQQSTHLPIRKPCRKPLELSFKHSRLPESDTQLYSFATSAPKALTLSV